MSEGTNHASGVSLASGISLYGKGVFTTLAIVEGQTFLWEKHWHRLTSNAAALGVDLSDHSEKSVQNALFATFVENRISSGRARVTLSDETPSRVWSHDEGEKKTSLNIIVAERRPVAESFKLTTSPHRVNTTSPLIGIKSCNYLEHLLAYEEATKRGFHEAIRSNERGEVASACMANVFWEKGGKLFTPSLKTGCLPGTTREFILEKVECEEVQAGIQELENADRIFLTSAGLGITAVADFNGRPLDNSNHQLSSLLAY